MSDSKKKALDFSYETPSNYFKSSFARSIITDCNNQSRSLDYVYFDNSTISDEPLRNGHSSLNRRNNKMCSNKTGIINQCNTSAYNSSPFSREQASRTVKRRQNSEILKLWRLKQEAVRKGELPEECPPPSRERTRDFATPESDVLRLRKECQRLVEENRNLQSAISARPAQLADAALQQSQVGTLVWQLKQAESSRQMYREVMEQVVKFLERAHKNLDVIHNKMSPLESRETEYNRVPRSRSVHTVNLSPSRLGHQSNSVLNFPRAKSSNQIQEEAHNYSTFRDFTWRRQQKVREDPEEVPPNKLSQEAFRLLRIAQSLLNTREPDLAQKFCSSFCSDITYSEANRDSIQDLSSILPYSNSASQRSSAAFAKELDPPQDKHSVSELSSSLHRNLGLREYNTSPSALSYSSLQNSHGAVHNSLETISIHSSASKNADLGEYKNTSLTSGLELAFAGGCSSPTSSLCHTEGSKDSSCGITSKQQQQQLSEDESGFSSMSSFQEVGLPLSAPGCYDEVGLPPTPPPVKHRHSLSSPENSHISFTRHNRSFCLPGESLRVLWV